MNKHTGWVVAAALALSLAAPAGAWGPAFYSATVNGDYVVGGNASRTPPFGGTQGADPFPVAVAWPGTVVKAYLNWNYLTFTPGAPPEASVTLNGFPVVAGLSSFSSPDTCWGRDSVASYTADVTAIVAAAGPGVFAVGSALDDPVTGRLGDGVSLLVVYDNGGPSRRVNVYEGAVNSNPASPATGVFSMDFAPAYPGGPTHFFVNALDGQTFGFPGEDDFFINGVLVSGALPGTNAIGNAWAGLLGPGGGSLDTFVRYDHAEADISGLMTPGDTSVFMETVGSPFGWDCIGHTFGAFSYVPEPASISFVLIGLGLLRRRLA